MKNIITTSLVVLSAFGFAACSSDSGTRVATGDAPTPRVTGEGSTIGTNLYDADWSLRREMDKTASQNFSGPADGSTIGTNLYDADWSLRREMDKTASQNFSGPADGSTIGTDLYPGAHLS